MEKKVKKSEFGVIELILLLLVSAILGLGAVWVPNELHYYAGLFTGSVIVAFALFLNRKK